MGYLQTLLKRAFVDTWNLVFDRSFLSAVIALGIFFGTFWFLRCRKQHEEAKRALKDFGIAAVITACAFLIVFLLNVLIFTPAALYSEEHASKIEAEKAKTTAENTVNALKNAPPASPPPFQITETDVQARKELKETKDELTKTQTELTATKAKLQKLDPKEQPIVSISATANILIRSSEQLNTRFMDGGGRVGFGRGTDMLLATTCTESVAQTVADGKVMFNGQFNLAAEGLLVGKPVRELSAAEYIQLEFIRLPLNAEVVSGTVVVTINNSQRFEFDVPAQKANGWNVLIRDLYRMRTNLEP